MEIPAATATREILFYSKSGAATSWLSNCHPCTIVIDGKAYGSAEHYYQSQKCADPAMAEWVRLAPTPQLAKRAAHALLKPEDVVPDWEKKKVEVMERALEEKFLQNPELRERLLATGDAILHWSTSDDMFWGVKGRDILGKMLMELRDALTGFDANTQALRDESASSEPGLQHRT